MTDTRPSTREDQIDPTHEVVAAISHDLGAGTRQLNAFASLLSDHVGDQLDEVGAGYLSRIISAAATFDSRITALTMFARTGSDPIAPSHIPACEAVAEAIETVTTEMPDAEPIIDVGSMPTVWADRRQLVTVFSELIRNSIKFSTDRPRISITAEETENEHILTVGDNGPGFRERDAAVAFDLFKRFHHATIPGTGTGLAIVRRIAERHDGTVTIDTAPAEGAHVLVCLPRVDDE